MKNTLNTFEVLDNLIELFPNAKIIQIKTEKEDVDRLRNALESEVSDSFSFGSFKNESVSDDFFGMNYGGISFLFNF